MHASVELESQVLFHGCPVEGVSCGELGGQCRKNAAPFNAGHVFDPYRYQGSIMIYQLL